MSKTRIIDDPKRKMQVMEFLLDSIKASYDHPSGIFHEVKIKMGGIEFEKLPPHIVTKMLEDSFMHFLNGITDCTLPDKLNRSLWEDQIDQSVSSDHIVIKDPEDFKKFQTYWKKPGETYISTPSDLFFAETVPLMDFTVLTSMQNLFKEVDDEDLKNFERDTMQCRFVIFPDYIQRVRSLTENNPIAYIGAIVYKSGNKKIKKEMCFPFSVTLFGETLLFKDVGYRNMSRKEIGAMNIQELHNNMTQVFNLWYGIQLALLNPVTETVIQKLREKAPIIRKERIGIGKKRKIVYVKRYVIKYDDFENEYKERRKNNMSCPLWYVVGHWRTYQNGKKIFIKGFWKGPERGRFKDKNINAETLNNIVGQRERGVKIKEDNK